MDVMLVFWILHIPAMIVFLAGTAFTLSIWLQGTVNGRSDISAGRKLGLLIRDTLATIFSARLGAVLKAFVWDGAIHPTLFREHKLRWTAHFFVFGGILLLTILSFFSFISVDILIPVFRMDNLFTAIFANKDHALTAFLNEFGGLVVMVGLVIVIVRRYLIRELDMRTRMVDTEIILFLVVIMVSGYLAQVARLSFEFEELPSSAVYAFVGYPIASLVRTAALPWAQLHDWLFLFHALFSSAVIAYIPFSKFFHAAAGAIIASVNSLPGEEAGAASAEVSYEQV
jgi:nitrate reductase gamma subunit